MAGDSPPFNPDLVISQKFPESTYTYSERDATLYALGVGACARDALDGDELKYVYHENGQKFIKVLPTFSTLFSLGSVSMSALIPGLEYDPRLLLHGQQYIEIYKPLPSCGRLQNKVALAGLHDKGKAAIIEIETKSYDESGELLCMNRMSAFLRGAGGFSTSSRPFSYSNYPANQVPAIKIPESKPFAAFEDSTQPSQALLYRLSGDYNPLHSDPAIAKVAGFSRPILHGLCSLGFAVRAIIKCICKGDPNMVKRAALRKILSSRTGLPNSSLLPPALLISCRGITSKLFVGGLSFYTNETGLSEAFSQHGQVVESKIIMDRVSDKSKGFGFVTFASEDEAQKALTEMNGKELNGRVIFVDYAKPRTDFGGGMPIARGPPENAPINSQKEEMII